MEQFKKILYKLLFPHPAVVLTLLPVAAGLLIYAFVGSAVHPAVTYGAYALSAYVLTVVCTTAPAIWRLGRDNPYLSRYRGDPALRMTISLYSSLAINLLYALLHLALGIYNHAAWYYALSGYYGLLAVIRFFLLQETRKKRLGQNRFFELLIYRLCGVLLVLTHAALAVMVSYIVKENRGFVHGEIVTIAMAAYTFYALTMAIIHAVRQRNSTSPVKMAAGAVSLASALVSMLSLETSMLAAFDDGSQPLFSQIITGATGGVVCTAVLAMAVFMIVQATRQIRKIKGASDHGA